MSFIISFPILGILVMLQTAVFSNLRILYGAADIVMLTIIAWTLQERVKNGLFWAVVGGLMMSFLSAVPFFPFLVGYIMVVAIAQIIKSRIWQIPALAMFFVSAIGTILVYSITLLILQFTGTRLEWSESINLVVLPSTLLNLLLALPVFLLVSDLAKWIFPAESD